MGSSPDRSRFPDGFQRTLYNQALALDGAAVDLTRGDTQVQIFLEPGKIGNTSMTMGPPLWEGQVVSIVGQGGLYLGATASVVVGTAFDQAGNTTVSVGSQGEVATLLGVNGRWQLVANDGATLS